MTNWENLVSDDELTKVARTRKKSYVEERVRREDWEQLAAEGYEHIRDYKDRRYIRVRKQKDSWTQFENKVWCLFYDMGFTEMNRDDQFRLSYGESASANKQIDVFAYDGDTVLIVECKKRTGAPQLKSEIEAMNGNMDGFRASIREHYGSGLKVKPIWATSDDILGDNDKERLKEFGIELFEPETIDYYISLTQHLGSASKYQLLGRLFEGQKIRNMDNEVPAIQGKMGGHIYYSFSIEPEKLLKIGYVLHRNDANEDMMPTYQRIIKKSRLQQIRKFINNDGYFPNSVIVSLETGKKGLQFDLKHGGGDDIAKLGVLHLPEKYRSAYIIDGQHRLYGYTDTKYAATNTIPVVAFENLSQDEQIRIFMDINENQKSVPKNLRNTLSADLITKSDSYEQRRKVLRLSIARQLGEDKKSPLLGHILIGENERTPVRCVTLDSIERGLKAGKLLTKFDKKDQPVGGQIGYFDDANIETKYAKDHLVPFLFCSFEYFKEKLPREWEYGEEHEGILTNNVGVNAFLRVFSDVIEFLLKNGVADPRKLDAKSLVEKCEPCYSAIVDFYRNIDSDTRHEIRSQLGGKGPVQHWRYLQRAIHEKFPEDFNPDGYDEWWADNSKQYNQETSEKINEIEQELKENVAFFMQQIHGEDWLESSLPPALDDQLALNLTRINNQHRREGKEKLERWDLVDLNLCLALSKERDYWSKGLQDILTEPEKRGKKQSKAVKTQWLNDIIAIADALEGPGYSVPKSDYTLVCNVYSWVVAGEHNGEAIAAS